jgi:Type II secretion system (T2SS), protein E, N-terminal domain
MAIDVGAAAAQRWRVTLEREELVPPLRDYLRRLGLSPEVGNSFELELEADEAELEEYVESWITVNSVTLHIGKVEPTPRPRAVEASPGASAPKIGEPRIGELLVRKGFITELQLAWALTESRATNELLGVVLLRERLIFEDELARTLSQQLSIPYVSIMRCGVNPHVARLIPYEVGMQAAAIPVRVDGSVVQVVFADPTDPRALDAVRAHLPQISVAVSELSDIKSAWREIARGERLGSG